MRRGVDEIQRGEAAVNSLVGIGNVLAHEVEVLRAKLKDARNRLDTIRETHPDIGLDYDIERIDAVLSHFERIPDAGPEGQKDA